MVTSTLLIFTAELRKGSSVLILEALGRRTLDFMLGLGGLASIALHLCVLLICVVVLSHIYFKYFHKPLRIEANSAEQSVKYPRPRLVVYVLHLATIWARVKQYAVCGWYVFVCMCVCRFLDLTCVLVLRSA